MSTRVLIVDDEDLFREDLAGLLTRKGLDCATASSGEQGLAMLDELQPDVILCDIKLPGINGIDVLDAVMRVNPTASVIVMTAYGELDTAISAFRKGAYDYLVKPILVEDVLAKISRLIDHRQLDNEVKLLRRQLASDIGASATIVGSSEPIKRVLKLVQDVSPTQSTVLLTGESGTGKEVAARAIHAKSAHPNAPFITINCAGIPDQLLESELFGHVKGSFTGAVRTHTGYFEMAGEGTILLDEISEMPLALQSKLLRVVEQREFCPVGSARPRPLSARIIASTNKDLRKAVNENQFRQDLYFRIAVFEVSLPPLRERRSDIPALIDYFIAKLNVVLNRRCLGVSPEALKCLMSYQWPGNVRELRNVIERAMIVGHDSHLNEDDLPEILASAKERTSPDGLRSAVRAYEQAFIGRILEQCGGNKEEAARRLNINPSTLYRKMADPSSPLPPAP